MRQPKNGASVTSFQTISNTSDHFDGFDNVQERTLPNRRTELSWKPVSLKPPFLLATILINSSLVLLLAFLLRKSSQDGGVYFASTEQEASTAANFLFLYFPTIFAVIYSTLWGWIDLDAKRLEPWFQMSSKDGALARDSVLLKYPVEFLALVPLKAAKRRQWSVLCVAIITVMIFWAVTPLQGSIFATSNITKSINTPIQSFNAFIDPSDQATKMNTAFLNTGYSTLWLGQQVPAFTTTEFALAPFFPTESATSSGVNSTLTAQTTLYATELSCSPPAHLNYTELDGVIFDDGKGCIAGNVILQSDLIFGNDFAAYYIGYYDDPFIDSSLQLSGCPISASHTFLAVWKRASDFAPDFKNATNATALFCTPSYYSQQVQATVSKADFAVLNHVPLGPKVALTDSIFNRTQFEYILGTGVIQGQSAKANAQTDDQHREEISDRLVLHQDSQLFNMSLFLPTSNMVGFAVGSTHFDSVQYLDPEILAKAFTSAHKMLFAAVVPSLIDKSANASTALSAREDYNTYAVTLVGPITLSLEAFLVIIIFITAYLIYAMHNRPSALVSDPRSIEQTMMLSTDRELLSKFGDQDSSNTSQLEGAVTEQTFRLDPGDDIPRLRVMAQSASALQRNARPLSDSSGSASDTDVHGKKERPIELTGLAGGLFVLLLVALLAGMAVLYMLINDSEGLPLPTTNPVVQQILINYLPTILATLMEPFWILLNRLVCLMQPFNELRCGGVSASKSLALDYSALPPQLVSWRALQNGHYLIALLGIITLVANMLTVAFSGLFYISNATLGQSILVQPLSTAKFFGAPFNTTADPSTGITYDPCYVVTSNLSLNTPLSAWLTPKQYFLPIELPHSENNTGLEYQMTTTGISATLDCQELLQDDSDATYELSLLPNATAVRFSASYVQEGGRSITCRSILGITTTASSSQTNLDFSILGFPGGSRAFELFTSLVDVNGTSNTPEANFCSSRLVGAWVRTNITMLGAPPVSELYQPTVLRATTLNSLSATIISCFPRIEATPYNVTVDSSGKVLAAQAAGPSETSSELTSNMDVITEHVKFLVMDSSGTFPPVYHNDTLSNDWLNFMIKLLYKNNGFLDPTSRPPTFEAAATASADIFARAWAAQVAIKSSFLVPANRTVTSAIAAVKLSVQPRIFMSKVMFWIATAVLCIDLVGAIAVYTILPRMFLPRMPTSIASIIAFFAASHCVDDFRYNDARKLDEKSEGPQEGSGQELYGYGKFIGTDGKTHTGIDRSPFVVPLKFKKRRLWRRKDV